MKKRMIGLVPLVDAERESYWMLPGYMNGIEQAGGIPVMLPLTADPDTLQQLADTLDGFLLTGGQDVSPVFYQAQTVAHCEACCAERDAMEQALFGIAWAQDKPILGICCGIQLINILLGGMLYQDLPTKHPSPGSAPPGAALYRPLPYGGSGGGKPPALAAEAGSPSGEQLPPPGCEHIGLGAFPHGGVRRRANRGRVCAGPPVPVGRAVASGIF